MEVKTEHLGLNGELTLRDSSHSPLTVHTINLSLTKQENQLIDCRLTLSVNPELYQHIDTQSLFNLKPEIRGVAAFEFQPSPDIKIEISLKPDLLPHLVEHAANPNEAANYLLNISTEKPDDPLLSTENWLGLSVKQQQESGETGYTTFWNYINPSALANGGINSEEVGNAIANFFKEWTEANLSAMTQTGTSEILEGIVNFFAEVADVAVALAKPFAEQSIAQSTTIDGQIFAEMVNFFQQDEWPFYQIEGQPVLQTAFQGDNGKWTCLARAREQQQQMVFYSICPVNVPENKRLAVAEFITRANYGTIIGNFELDFNDGEIRYKTSIDVQGDSLSFELIKQLVYANVTMMDEYLPGILSVIEKDVSPKDAIAQIELIQPSSLSSELSSNLTDTQTPVTSPSPREELTLNPEHQTTIRNPVSVQLETISDILSLLTREEIAQFHRAIQLESTYQIKVGQTILAQLQSGLQTRLGELAEQVFNRTYKLLKAGNLSSKSLKFIQRYAEIAAKISWLKESSKRRDLSREITELSEISSRVEARLSQLTKNGISGKEEIEMLIEIEELKRQLTDQDHL